MNAAAGSDTLLQEAARLATHPEFEPAVLAYVRGLARLREAPRFVNMIVATDVRWRIIGFLLYLATDRERFGSEGGATYRRLLEVSSARREASARHVKSVLALLQLGGMVHVTTSPADRRVKFYRPTDRMFGFVRHWLSYGTAALDILEPDLRRGRFVGDRAFAEAFFVSGGRAQIEDPVALADHMPAPLSLLKPMLGGYSVVLAILLARFENVPTPSQHAIAARFGMSRRQVGNVMTMAQHSGLLMRDGPSPALIASFREWISIELAFYARHMRLPAAA